MKFKQRAIDPEGRVLLPKDWREKHGREVVILDMGEYIKIIPLEKKEISELFDSLEVELESKLTDWASLEKELREKIAK